MQRRRLSIRATAARVLRGFALASLLLTLSATGALAAGPQALPEQACNAGTATASERAPHRTPSEAIPHVEHSAFLPPVPYCHHFNPTASPPLAL